MTTTEVPVGELFDLMARTAEAWQLVLTVIEEAQGDQPHRPT